MRHFGLVVAVILLSFSTVFAQHSSSSSGSSSFSGSSGSSYSSSSSSGSSGSHSGGHSSGSSSSHSSTAESSHSNRGSTLHGSISDKISGSSKTEMQPEKRSFFSHLFHPFRKTEPKFAHADLRRPVCIKGHCVCPGGQAASKNGACGGPSTTNRQCESGAYWNGGVCAGFAEFRVNNCTALAHLMQQQAQRMGMAESSRQSSCSRDPSAQECSDLATHSAYENERYRSLQQQYEQCQRQQFSSNRYSFGSHSSAGLRNPFGLD